MLNFADISRINQIDSFGYTALDYAYIRRHYKANSDVGKSGGSGILLNQSRNITNDINQAKTLLQQHALKASLITFKERSYIIKFILIKAHLRRKIRAEIAVKKKLAP